MSHATEKKLISKSVGSGAAPGNLTTDVKIVEYLFNVTSKSKNKFPETGVCTQELIAAIKRFQQEELKFPHPDGRIDPGGRTLASLVDRARNSPEVNKAQTQSAPVLLGGAWLGKSSDIRGLFDFLGLTSSRTEKSRQQNTDLTHRTLVHSYFLLRNKHTSAGKITHTAILNSASTQSKLTAADFEAAATSLGVGISSAIIRAFAEVESGGRSGFGPAGLPVIAFEGHLFRKLTGKKYDSTHPLLSYKYVQKAGPQWKSNNKDQVTAWNTLRQAIELDSQAALQSCSWGMFQVMGFNYSACGYASVDDFVTSMKAGERGQLDAFVGFCKASSALINAMKNNDFAKMASLYNGADYGNYDTLIKNAFNKYSSK